MRVQKLTLLFIGVLLCSYIPPEKEKEKNDLDKENLKGKVKSVAVIAFGVVRVDGKLQKGRKIHNTTSKYNNRGYLLENISSSGDDTVENKYVHFKGIRNVFNYDENGVLVSNSRYNENGEMIDSASYKVDTRGNRIDWNTYKGDGTVEWNYNREYDNQGNLIETNEYYKGKLRNRHTYKYNANLDIVEENFFEGEGRLKLKEVFSYDDKHNITEVMDYDHTGNFRARYTYAYDGKGNQTEEREYTAEKSKKHRKIVTKYDKDNNVSEVSEFTDQGKLTYQCKLDKWGNHISDITYNPDGTVLEKVTQKIKYDAKGNQVENERFLADGKADMRKRFVYTYDKLGNWFLKITYENNKPVRITERFIDYFDAQ